MLLANWLTSTLMNLRERWLGGCHRIIVSFTSNGTYSKTELKRRQKQRANEEKKKGKEPAAPPKAGRGISAEEEESNLTPNVSLRSTSNIADHS